MLCKVLVINGSNMLVEYVDADNVPQRVYLPAVPDAGKEIEIADPAQGVPYGNLAVSDITIRATDLTRALRQAGLWQRDDIARHPQLYVQTVVALAGLSLSSILQKENQHG